MSFNPVVLYVEDDQPSRQIMNIFLTAEMKLKHVTILSDSSTFDATIRSLEPRPDLILLDIHVKPWNGFDMLRHLRTVPGYAETPVVALTASVMNEEVEQLRMAGFSGVVSKPVDLDTFAHILECIMNGEVVWNKIDASWGRR